MRKYLTILLFLTFGLKSYAQSINDDLLHGRGMFILGHILPGTEQALTEKKPLLGYSLMGLFQEQHLVNMK